MLLTAVHMQQISKEMRASVQCPHRPSFSSLNNLLFPDLIEHEKLKFMDSDEFTYAPAVSFTKEFIKNNENRE